MGAVFSIQLRQVDIIIASGESNETARPFRILQKPVVVLQTDFFARFRWLCRRILCNRLTFVVLLKMSFIIGKGVRQYVQVRRLPAHLTISFPGPFLLMLGSKAMAGNSERYTECIKKRNPSLRLYNQNNIDFHVLTFSSCFSPIFFLLNKWSIVTF